MRSWTVRGDVIGYSGIEVWSDAAEGATRLGHLTGAPFDPAEGPWPNSIAIPTSRDRSRDLKVQLHELRLTRAALEETDKNELIMSLVIPRYAQDRWDHDTNRMVFSWPAIVVDSEGYSDLFDHSEFHLIPQPEDENENR